MNVILKRLPYVFAALFLVSAGIGGAVSTASATPSPPQRICHANHSAWNEGTGAYVEETVNTSSVNEMRVFLDNGHGTHTGPLFDPGAGREQPAWGDIVPPFTYEAETVVDDEKVVVEVEYPGMNWPAGRSVWEAGCTVPTPPLTCAAGEVWTDLDADALVDPGECSVPPPLTCAAGEVWTDLDADALVDPGECSTPPPPPPPPPLTCAAGETWTDLDADGLVDSGECSTPPPPPPPPVTPTVSEPVAAAPEAANVVVSPLPATVEETPVPVVIPPQRATVPSAARAGGGGTAPAAPIGAMVLLGAGLVGVTGSALRLVRNR